MLKELFNNFSNNTTIHGFSYIVKPFRHRIERIFWILSVLISFVSVSFLMLKILSDTDRVQNIIYIDENYVSVEDLHFPAVSICYGLQYRGSYFTTLKYDEFLMMLKQNETKIEDYSLKELKHFQILSLVQKDRFLSDNFPNLNIPTDDFLDRIQELRDTLPLVSEENEGHAYSWTMTGQWIGQYLVYGKKVLSDTGVCFGFNFPNQDQVYKSRT